ncbi:hypothetical protein ACVIW2_002105 [Bradyrhizobium huanghuaihaiense]
MDFSAYSYVPIVAVRPAEMTALEELSPADKEAMLPYIILRPWLSAHHFESVLAKIDAARGHRPMVVDLTSDLFTDVRRPVHDTLDELREPGRGYRNFHDFVAEHENFIPSIQLSAPAELGRQVARINDLGRGCVIRLTEPIFAFSRQIAELFANVEDHSKVHFILDYRRQSSELLARAAGAIGILTDIRRILPECFLSVSASTFPESFVDLDRQEIFERQFHEEVFRHVGHQNVLYSDRASVRAESLSGGSGPPAPRIDNALRTNWQFFRVADNDDRDEAFQQAAENAVRSDDWDDLNIWGTDEIVRTAAGQGAIASAARSTAVRINIHLHRQANFDDPDAMPGTEEIWTD